MNGGREGEGRRWNGGRRRRKGDGGIGGGGGTRWGSAQRRTAAGCAGEKNDAAEDLAPRTMQKGFSNASSDRTESVWNRTAIGEARGAAGAGRPGPPAAARQPPDGGGGEDPHDGRRCAKGPRREGASNRESTRARRKRARESEYQKGRNGDERREPRQEVEERDADGAGEEGEIKKKRRRRAGRDVWSAGGRGGRTARAKRSSSGKERGDPGQLGDSERGAPTRSARGRERPARSGAVAHQAKLAGVPTRSRDSSNPDTPPPRPSARDGNCVDASRWEGKGRGRGGLWCRSRQVAYGSRVVPCSGGGSRERKKRVRGAKRERSGCGGGEPRTPRAKGARSMAWREGRRVARDADGERRRRTGGAKIVAKGGAQDGGGRGRGTLPEEPGRCVGPGSGDAKPPRRRPGREGAESRGNRRLPRTERTKKKEERRV